MFGGDKGVNPLSNLLSQPFGASQLPPEVFEQKFGLSPTPQADVDAFKPLQMGQQHPDLIQMPFSASQPLLAPQQLDAPQPVQLPDPSQLVHEFRNLSVEQQPDFERIYHGAHHGGHHGVHSAHGGHGGHGGQQMFLPPQQQMAMQQRMAMMQMQQMHHMQQMQQMQQQQVMLQQRQMEQFMQQQQLQQPRQVVQQQPSQTTTEAPQQTAPTTDQAELTSPQPQQPISPVGMGMGMDQEMINKLMNSDDPKWRNSKFLKFISQISRGEVEFKDNKVVQKAPEEVQAPPPAESQGELIPHGMDEQQHLGQRWAEQYMRQQREFLGDIDSEDYEGVDWQSALQRARESAPQPRDPEYKFQTENPFMDNKHAYREGLKLLKAGKLKEAIACFEAAVQKEPEHADAWRYLGQAQAENEDETKAIAALLKCVTLDPYNLPALMMLGVSYTNDLEETRALKYLRTWMLNNPDYQNTSNQSAEQVGDGQLHDEVVKMFLNALNTNPRDADVHTVLGVLYHISNDYDKAIECFRNALKYRPEDPALWNKLGATQANSSRSADAVHAYKRALQLRPTYVRALANLAISYANQGMHEDAARTYLATLRQNPNASHVWSYLRISLSHLGKEDLVELTQERNVELFREHFDF